MKWLSSSDADIADIEELESKTAPQSDSGFLD